MRRHAPMRFRSAKSFGSGGPRGGGYQHPEIANHRTEETGRILAQVDRIGRYEIRGKLGEGGFGTVYKAYDAGTSRSVALKVLKEPSDPGLLARFRVEAGMTGNLHHPNIVEIYEFSLHQGQPFLVME